MSYSLYVHIMPNDKLYIGITKWKVQDRWRNNGEGYKSQILFWRAIQKYGWDNIQHIVLFEGLSKEVACECEKYLIAKYQTNNPKFGYNVAIGGEHNSGFHFHHTENAKKKISIASKGHITSEEQKRKISLARKGIFHHTEESKKLLRQKALNMTDEQKKKISDSVKKRWKEGRFVHTGDNFRNNIPWNKGLTKEDYRVAKYIRKPGTFHHTEETKKILSEKHKGMPAHNRKKIICVETGIVYSSISEATKCTGINNISKALNPKYTAGGYHWKEI